MVRIIIAADEDVEEAEEYIEEGVPADEPLKVPPRSSWNPVDEEIHDIPKQENLVPELEGDLRFDEDPKFSNMITIQKIWAAINNFKPLWVRYRNLRGEISERILSRFEDDKSKIEWAVTTLRPHVTAWDSKENDWRNFLFEGILEAKILKR
jgi:predicted DNA-binding transcriptional regulator YafY